MNPAVSFAFALTRHFPWTRVGAYWVAQLAGALAAAAILRASLGDVAHVGAVGEVAAIAIGGTVGLDAMFGGPVTGASMNPARSIGPALVSGDLHALWVYIVAPLLGAAVGAFAYQFVRGEQNAPIPSSEEA